MRPAPRRADILDHSDDEDDFKKDPNPTPKVVAANDGKVANGNHNNLNNGKGRQRDFILRRLLGVS